MVLQRSTEINRMTQNSAKRNTAIDTARGIAALLMIIGHLGMNNQADQFISSFHMPLFFVISGMTMREEADLKGYIGKRIRRILVPYIVFALIFSQPGYGDWFRCIYASRESILSAGSQTVLWFLPCLFLADLLFQLVLKFCRNWKLRLPVCAALCAVGFILPKVFPLEIGFPFNFDVALVALPFLLLGYELKRMQWTELLCKGKRSVKLAAGVILILAVIVLIPLNLPPSATPACPHVEMAIGSYGNPILFYLTAAAGSMGVLLLSEAADGSLKLLERFGRCTITCLVLHRIVIAMVNRIGTMFSMNQILIWIAATIAAFLLTFPVHWLLETYVPNLVGKR